jgi:cytochrome c oxidase subunit 1
MGTFLGHLHFWPSLICMNVIFAPMFIQGMAGFHRRAYDGGATYEQTTDKWLWLNEVTTFGAWALALAQVPFIINLFMSIRLGRKIQSDNPWNATTLDWGCPTPPPHGNFLEPPIVYRDPYEYSVPGAPKDFTLQYEPDPDSGSKGKDKVKTEKGALKS